jgi:hypothetical protein
MLLKDTEINDVQSLLQRYPHSQVINFISNELQSDTWDDMAHNILEKIEGSA